MSDLTDSQLLREYTELRSEAAFAELVRRHVDLVYGAGLRIVRDTHLAEDVAQGVFMALARSAPRLLSRPVLTGWLYNTTRNLAANAIRSDARRRAHEREDAAVNDMLSTDPESIWEKILPHLDAALGALCELDRDALLLRYFQRKTAREIAQVLGTSEEAAQKRVGRAVERMRHFFAKRGVTVGAGLLAAAITTNAGQAAPAGLAASISTAAVLTGSGLSTSTVMTVAKTIAMTTLQKSLVTAALVAVAGAGIYQARQVSTLRDHLQRVQQEQALLTENIKQLERERDEATNRLASLSDEMARTKGGPSDLAKLRAEVTRLLQEKRDLPAARVAWLKQKLQQMPDKSIPELQLLSGDAWANAALATDDGARMAFRQLRDEAVDKFLKLTRTAIQKYTAANNGLLPGSLLELKPYFETPVTDAMLQRYELLQTGQVDPDKSLVRKKIMVDDEYDSDQFMSMNGGGGGNVNKVKSAVGDAIGEFARDNFGQLPSDPSQLVPYLKEPVDASTVQKYLNEADAPPPEAAAIAPALKAYAEAHNGQWPAKPSDLLPYLDTPEQKAAFGKMVRMSNPASK